MSKLTFGTKAETLAGIAKVLKSASVLPLAHFTVREWRKGAGDALAAIQKADWARKALIVRSSATAEDGHEGSLAGRFLTIQGVLGVAALRDAVAKVIDSYGDGCKEEDRVLVQPMLSSVRVSGVAFSQDPNTGSPYIVINHHVGADTAAVTGGRGHGLRTVYVARGSPVRPPAELEPVVALVMELEELLGKGPIDVEFAIDEQGKLYLLQVRPLAIRKPAAIAPAAHKALLASICGRIDTQNRPHPYLHGRRTVYGVMPDWNPAEIVGIRPRPLALSLYREIITDAIWAYQRHNYGYKNLRSFPLLLQFEGLPYIDVRVSFNSFIPADIPDELANRLVDYYINCLVNAPTLHDKVEFQIVLSCYSFDVDKRLDDLQRHGFSKEDCRLIKASLNRLTNRIIHAETGLWRQDTERIETLVRRHALVSAADLDTVARIYWLLEDCKRYGTLPFAGLARAGFIAVQMLGSLVSAGILSEQDRASFMAGLDTISSRLGRDLATLDRNAFLQAYGHLRPGTYDILSPRYDEAPDQYFDWSRPRGPAAPHQHRPFALSLPQMRTIEELLDEHGLDHDVVGLLGFLEAGIRGREYSKFVFTRSLSDALSLIGRLGVEHGFSLEDMSYLDIHALYSLHAAGGDVRAVLADSIERGRARYVRTQSLVLPPLLASGADVWCFEMPPTEPNYVTQNRVSAPAARVDSGADLEGKIALITNADPGFDWIFSRRIAGFITAYGGVNSHMAIRASELQMPAVIGAGEVLFAAWSSAQVLEIDAANRQVHIIR
jgi:phosphohistidine swiveling domain-containing protein